MPNPSDLISIPKSTAVELMQILEYARQSLNEDAAAYDKSTDRYCELMNDVERCRELIIELSIATTYKCSCKESIK